MGKWIERQFDRYRWIVLWTLLVLICTGLGYPTLNRFDARKVGNTDSAEYYALVASDSMRPPTLAQDRDPRPRILVPLIAKTIYRAVVGRTSTADPVFLALLLANSLFMATGEQRDTS